MAATLPALLAGAAAAILLADLGLLGDRHLPFLVAGATAALLAGGAAPRRQTIALAACGLLLGAAAGTWRAPSGQLPTGPDSLAAAVGGGSWRIDGTLADDPRPKGERWQAVLANVRISPADGPPGEGAPRSGRLLAWLPRGLELRGGDRVRLVAPLEAPRDFDGFAYRAYLARQGIGAVARAYAAERLGTDEGALAAGLREVRAGLHEGLLRLVPEPAAALGAGILLGVRSGIDPAVAEQFADAGLTHVVAISGWNIAIVAAVVGALTARLRTARGGRWIAPAAMLATIGVYVLLTGASPSVVRAALMAAAMVVARLGGSPAHAGSALMAAGLVMLLAAPAVLWDVGFQLSFLATAGLIAFAARLSGRLAAVPGAVREPLALTLAAQLATLPVILANFERLSLVAPLANVLVVPLVPLAMAASAGAALAGVADAAVRIGLAGEAIAWIAGGSAWLYLSAMMAVAAVCASLPWAAVEAGIPAPLAIAYYPVLAAAWAARRHRPPSPGGPVSRFGLAAELTLGDDPAAEVRGPPGRTAALARRVLGPFPLAGATLALLVGWTLATGPDGRLHLTTLDVGQGDAILVVAPSGATMLIDGGPDPDLLARRLGERLPFHRRTLDVVLLTHSHEDHVAGLVEALRRFQVRAVVDVAHRDAEAASYRPFLAAAEREAETDGARLVTARAGHRIGLGDGVVLEILFPAEADASRPPPDDDPNNHSVVAILRHGGFAALLTGDAEMPVERALIARGLIGEVDLLKVGHHGSRSSTGAAFLELLDPAVATISLGAENRYGHPHPETMATLAARPGLRTFRTDLHGGIEVISDGSRLWVRTDRPAAGAHRVGG